MDAILSGLKASQVLHEKSSPPLIVSWNPTPSTLDVNSDEVGFQSCCISWLCILSRLGRWPSIAMRTAVSRKCHKNSNSRTSIRVGVLKSWRALLHSDARLDGWVVGVWQWAGPPAPPLLHLLHREEVHQAGGCLRGCWLPSGVRSALPRLQGSGACPTLSIGTCALHQRQPGM